MSTPAILALQDGTVFHGTSIGADGQTIGEVVFNTAMTGYQEILTDPSYCRQIVTLTYPHIGNTGTNSDDMESSKIHASGLIIRDSTMLTSSWRSERSFSDFLKQGETVAIRIAAEGIQRRPPRLQRQRAGAQRVLVGRQLDDVVETQLPLEFLDGLARLIRREPLHAIGCQRQKVAAHVPVLTRLREDRNRAP